MTLQELQIAFCGLSPSGPPWPWERRLLQLIIKSKAGIDAFEVIHAVIDNPERVVRILPFLCNDDIYKVRALASAMQPVSDDLKQTVDFLIAWTTRQTIKKMLTGNSTK